MTLSIIIINWNSEKYLKLCLNSIIKHISHVPYEIIVIDNNSSDKSVEMTESVAKKVIIKKNTENSGFPKAVNQGIKLCKGQNILILNPDIVIKKKCIENMISTLRSNKRIGAVGAKILTKDQKSEWPYIKFPSLMQILLFHTAIKRITLKNKLLRKHFLEVKNKNEELELIPGGCLLIKKEVFQEIGKMDEQFLLWFEDTDLCLRMKQNNWQLIYEPKAQVIHFGGGSTHKLSTYTYLYIFYSSMFKYFKKHNGYIYASLALIIMIINMFITAILTTFLLIIKFNNNKKYIEGIKCRLNLVKNWSILLFNYNNETTFS